MKKYVEMQLQLQHYLEVSFQLYAPVALLQGKEVPVSLGWVDAVKKRKFP
jgi:hypothetical protein